MTLVENLDPEGLRALLARYFALDAATSPRVVLLAGRADEAAAALEHYERKENLTMAGRTRDRLAALRPTTR